jgi:hypothetical protein
VPISFFLANPGAFPKVVVDVILSSNGDAAHPLDPDALVDQKVSTVDDVGDKGTTLAKALVPSPIGVDAPSNPRPSIIDRVPTVPPSDRRSQKRLCITAKQSNLVPCANQVMTQVELPPYHRPYNPLDLIAVEIIFGCIFEAPSGTDGREDIGAEVS